MQLLSEMPVVNELLIGKALKRELDDNMTTLPWPFYSQSFVLRMRIRHQ